MAVTGFQAQRYLRDALTEVTLVLAAEVVSDVEPGVEVAIAHPAPPAPAGQADAGVSARADRAAVTVVAGDGDPVHPLRLDLGEVVRFQRLVHCGRSAVRPARPGVGGVGVGEGPQEPVAGVGFVLLRHGIRPRLLAVFAYV